MKKVDLKKAKQKGRKKRKIKNKKSSASRDSEVFLNRTGDKCIKFISYKCKPMKALTDTSTNKSSDLLVLRLLKVKTRQKWHVVS